MSRATELLKLAAKVEEPQDQGRIVAIGRGRRQRLIRARAGPGGIAMPGTDVAVERRPHRVGDLRRIAKARALSRKTMGNIRDNLFLAFVYNVLRVCRNAVSVLRDPSEPDPSPVPR